ncbi:cytidylyltransferase family-domain-containing protein [Spinellus fusiger]|nr:cytidylyltransferase family-domain-containing protein [Spinellus fusiger]
MLAYTVWLCYSISMLSVESLKDRLTHLCWVHIATFLSIFQIYYIASNLYRGFIWFLFPVCLIIVNDSIAYFGGRLLGRTPLSSMSPNKTLEGFFIALFITVCFSYYVSLFLYLSFYLYYILHPRGVSLSLSLSFFLFSSLSLSLSIQ